MMMIMMMMMYETVDEAADITIVNKTSIIRIGGQGTNLDLDASTNNTY